MTQPTTTPEKPQAPPPPLPPIPPDVQEFAEKVGVAPSLPGILALTLRIFPPDRVSLSLVDDPEIPDYRHILIEIDFTGWDVEQMLQARNRWTAELIERWP